MAHPLSPITAIGVEASKEPELPGEYAIDISEYEDRKDGSELVTYSQLKHSTQRVDQPFVLSELCGTLAEFGKRFLATKRTLLPDEREKEFAFAFVSNRPVAANIKEAAGQLGTGMAADTSMRRDLAASTGLTGDDLKSFFMKLAFRDAEQDYQTQRRTLRGELAECLVGFVEGDDADRIVNLVADKVMPKDEKGRSDGLIHRQDLLLRLNATEQELFPAMPAFDPPGQLLRREQHAELVASVLDDSAPLIIHAEGGVGKTVVACQIAESLPVGSEAVVYDCFGNATYRNPAQPRHRARDAFLQMANELAVRGRCEPLFPRDGVEPAEFFKAFAVRLRQAVTALNEATPGAKLVLLVDAADNAEMVAEGPPPQPCFAAMLLEMALPSGCCLAMLCRTERIHYLRPSPRIRRVQLREFSLQESGAHLRTKFATATDNDVREFHRLSNGNPRVQAQEMAMPGSTLTSVLSNLGPRVTTVDAQIAARLDKATATLKVTHGAAFAAQMDAICYGLANLPPLIPIQVLARAAGVTPEEIRSMASDFGRSLYVTGNSVQFRDEPTETWFLKRFSADRARIADYAARLKPLAREFTYVAQALPLLLYRAGDYQQVIDLALSDAHLPVNNSLDERAVRIDRLQFAFKSALSDQKLPDAMRIAFRAGEETAGDSRQLEMFAENTDLVAALQAPHRVQELALRHKLGRFWPGCENLYTASLLCSVPDFKGEGRGYLRSAIGWLHAVLADERKSERRRMPSAQSVQDEHLAELVWSRLVLDGPKGMVDELGGWKPRDLPFRLGRRVISRLVDAGRFCEIEEIAREGRKMPFLIIALADELGAVGRLPPTGTLEFALKLIGLDDALSKQLSKSDLRNDMAAAAISTLEACAAHGLPAADIRAALDRFVPLTAALAVRGDYGEEPRKRFVRAASLRAVLAGESEPTLKSMLPPELSDGSKKFHRTDDDKDGDHFLTSLIPWYYLRAKLLAGATGADAIPLNDVLSRSRAGHPSYYRSEKLIELEVADARFAALLWKTNATPADLESFLAGTIHSKSVKYWLGRRIAVLRASNCTPHLETLRIPVEQSCRVELREAWEGSPQEHASSYMSLARAVLALKPTEAAAYFDEATQVVSRFGDEVLERWRAIMAVAGRRAVEGPAQQELAYRLFRCAEEVGDYEDTIKYFERPDAIAMVTRLNPAAGIAGLSRWRDREVGWFGEQLVAVATELLRQRTVAATEAWGLTGFEPCRASENFACECLAAESEQAASASLWARLDADLTLEHGRGASWKKLAELAAKRGLLVPVSPPESVDEAKEVPSFKSDSARDVAEARAWEAVWASAVGHDVSTVEGFERVRSALDAVGSWRSNIYRLMDLVPEGRETAFLALILEQADARYTTLGEVIATTRKRWLSITSVQKYWPDFLRGVGRRCCFELCNGYRLIALRDFNEVDDGEMDTICLGIGDGLAAWDGPLHAGSFFGFIASNASRLSPTEAEDLLDFGLKRFERQLRPEKGDGPWREQLRAPESPIEALAGLVWSALGSPYAETRWQAVHCVRRWAETGCAKPIAALLEWDRQATVGAFGGRAYFFYFLHARLYLLFGLHRATVDHPNLLTAHAPVLAGIALDGLPHALIQRTAAQAALLIARKNPRVLGLTVQRKLKRVGVASGPRRRVKHDSEPIPTPWHLNGQVDTSFTYRFDMDFDDHWLNPLADVFGANREQVIELAKEVVVKELKGAFSEDFRSDARHHQWFNEDRGVRYYKSDYPRTDDQEFYFAYHSMHIVAGRLLQKMRVTVPTDHAGSKNEWEDWLDRHGLSRGDGRWLADRRDPAPAVRRDWLRNRPDENWQWSLTSEDFVDCLCAQSSHTGWLCVDGAWSDHDSTQRVEKIRVSSALVRPEMGDSLANSLRWSDGPNHYYLPNYRQHGTEFDRSPFDLMGWIWDRSGGDSGLDSMDPFARGITYPARRIGPAFATMLKLATDQEGREWRRGRQRELVALAELWSEREQHARGSRENPFRAGNRLMASPTLLRDLCKATKRQLLFSVSIDRRIDRSYGSSQPDYGIPASHQIFILSADGWLRDPKKDYRIG